MTHNIDYENFLVARPLWAVFDEGRYGIPQIWNTSLSKENASYSKILNFKNLTTKSNITNFIIENFAYDYDLETIWRNPFSKLKRLRKTLAVLTPDFSITPTMKKAQVIANTFKNRWIGCFYQQYSIDVIPTISWAQKWTFPICSQGIPLYNPVAISTIGVVDKEMFLSGYNYFMNKIKPKYVICYGKIIKGMYGDIICFSYEEAFMPNKRYEQLSLFDVSRLNVINKEEQ